MSLFGGDHRRGAACNYHIVVLLITRACRCDMSASRRCAVLFDHMWSASKQLSEFLASLRR